MDDKKLTFHWDSETSEVLFGPDQFKISPQNLPKVKFEHKLTKGMNFAAQAAAGAALNLNVFGQLVTLMSDQMAKDLHKNMNGLAFTAANLPTCNLPTSNVPAEKSRNWLLGDTAVFGIIDPLPPLEGFPEGRVKVRMRSEDFLIVQVKTPERIRAFTVKHQDGKLVPHLETDPPPYGQSMAAKLKELKREHKKKTDALEKEHASKYTLLVKYRTLLFGEEFQDEPIEVIRAHAEQMDEHFANFANLDGTTKNLPE